MINAVSEMDGPVQRRNRRKYADYALQLHALSERPEFLGKAWGWPDIAAMLGISVSTAQHLVQWMRKNYTEQYWTVGTYKTDYLTIPTKQARVALDGMLNQQLHLITRLQTMVQGCETLAKIDPDRAWQIVMEANARHFRNMLGLENEFRELLVMRAEGLGWSQEPEPALV